MPAGKIPPASPHETYRPGEVTPEDLARRGAVRRGELIKVLGTGEAVSGLRVSAHAFSASAAEKIAAAGGSTTQI